MRVAKEVREGRLKQGSLYNFAVLISRYKKDTNLYFTNKHRAYIILKDYIEEEGYFLSLNSLKKHFKTFEDLGLIKLKKVIFLDNFFYIMKIDYEKIKSYIVDFEGAINE